ncbi:hypothetical protein L7F22_019943 [Adiantum nelumboides]|nr:hypothetical protein [Adiantum nelumboides]
MSSHSSDEEHGKHSPIASKHGDDAILFSNNNTISKLDGKENNETEEGIRQTHDDVSSIASSELPQGRSLGMISAVFIMANRIVGTGVFATTGTILGQSGSVGMSLLYWIIGSIVAFTGYFVYAEFASAMPRNGGELNYLEKVYRKPKFLVASMYGAQALLLGQAAGNAYTAGQYFIRAGGNESREWAAKGIGIAILLAAVIAHGFAALAGHVKLEQKPRNFDNAFAGSRNDIYGPIALLVITILYELVQIAYFAAVPREEVLQSKQIIAALFFKNVFGERSARALSVFVALSAVANVFSVVFSQGRLNQALGRDGLIPFSKFFASNRPFKAPLAGVSWHVAMTLIIMLAPPAGDAYNFVLNLSSYPLNVVNSAVGLGLLSVYLPRRFRPQWAKDWSAPIRATLPIALFYTLVSIFLVIVPWISPKRASDAVYETLWCAIECRVCHGYTSDHPSTDSERSSIQLQKVNDFPQILQGIHNGISIPTAHHNQSTTSSVQYDQLNPNRLPTNSSMATSSGEQHQSFDSLLSSIWNEVMDGETPIDWNWMNADSSIDARSQTPNPIETENIIISSSNQVGISENGAGKRNAILQSQLERLCTSQTQLLGVTHFFNHVVQCFHIIPAEANRWRIVFGNLSLQSEVVFRLVTSVGLISLSHKSQTNHRAIGYSHMTYSLRVWNELVQEGKKQSWQHLYSKNNQTASDQIEKVTKSALEVLAIAILVAHVEQFDSGIAHETNKCLPIALNLILTILRFEKEHKCVIDTGIGSHFRFLVRILLWWDTFSQTMGSGSGVPFEEIQEIILAIRTWEEEDTESVLDSTQCVTGWPIDLLEAVARTSKVEKGLVAFECDRSSSILKTFSTKLHANSSLILNDIDAETAKKVQVLLCEARATEAQIRSCRPRSIIQDSVAAAELRFILFEILQAGALIYFARVLLGSMDGVKKEILLILRFLNSLQTVQKTTEEPQQSMKHLQYIKPRREVPEWSNNWAADGHVTWAYLQASIAAKPDQQGKCRPILQKFIDIAHCGALHVFLNLVEEIWEQRKTIECSEEGAELSPYFLNNIWKDVNKQRRWKQLLIF